MRQNTTISERINKSIHRQIASEYIKASLSREISIEYTKPVVSINISNLVDKIQLKVCTYLGMTVEIMKANTRKREIVFCRQVCMVMTREIIPINKMPFATIGLKHGDKDHATVIHAIKTISNLEQTNKNIRQQLKDIRDELKVISLTIRVW